MPPKIEEVALWIIKIVEEQHDIPDVDFVLHYSTDYKQLRVRIYSNEILRIKMTERARWFEIDMYDQFLPNYDNPMFKDVKNKRSTMWHVPLPYADYFYEYKEYILFAANESVRRYKEEIEPFI